MENDRSRYAEPRFGNPPAGHHIMVETISAPTRRFRWSKLRFELGHWIYLTIPDAGYGTKLWEWGERP